jgi:hypothetical protein
MRSRIFARRAETTIVEMVADGSYDRTTPIVIDPT